MIKKQLYFMRKMLRKKMVIADVNFEIVHIVLRFNLKILIYLFQDL